MPAAFSPFVGQWGPNNKVIWGTSPPAGAGDGTWAVGDIMFNTTPVGGQPVAWSCVASGTPGTWTAWANL